MKSETKVFVTKDGDFVLFVRGDEKKLMSYEDVVESLAQYKISKQDKGAIFYEESIGIAYLLKDRYASNLADVCEKFADILYPENIPA